MKKGKKKRSPHEETIVFLKRLRLNSVFGFGDGSNDAVVLCATHGAFLFVIFTFIVSHKYRDNQTEAYAKSNFV